MKVVRPKNALRAEFRGVVYRKQQKGPRNLVADDSQMVSPDRPRDDLAECRDTGDVHHDEHVRAD
jgi:hypothetical protein